MIYKSSTATAINQGDIFFDLPFVDFYNLNQLNVSTDPTSVPEEKTWEEVKNKDNIYLSTKVVPTAGIVVSQDCDNIRKNYISFAKIDTLANVLNKQSLPTNPKELRQIMTVGPSRRGYGYYYLPKGIGFTDKMAANFNVIFQLPRKSLLERRKSLRKGTLTDEALQHFRDTLSNYFTRYAYREWYPLNKDEFKEYFNGLPEFEKENVSPLPHQK